MNNYNKLINNLDTLGLNKFIEHLDNYIEYINNGSKTLIDALYELSEYENISYETYHKTDLYNCSTFHYHAGDRFYHELWNESYIAFIYVNCDSSIWCIL